MTETCWPCVMVTGRCTSKYKTSLELCEYGSGSLRTFAYLTFSISEQIPYERATITSNNYWNWYIRHVFLLTPAQVKVGEFLATFKEYPPRQKAASFTIDQVLDTMQNAQGK